MVVECLWAAVGIAVVIAAAAFASLDRVPFFAVPGDSKFGVAVTHNIGITPPRLLKPHRFDDIAAFD